MTKTTFIYALLDPDTDEIRYIGKADDMRKRFWNHIKPSSLKFKCHRTYWIGSLLAKERRPVMKLLEEVEYGNWKARECHWINFHRQAGASLVNTAEGGSGGMKSEWITDTMRENMRRAQTGKKRSAESIRKQAAARTGVKRKPETVEKMSLAHKGKAPSEATRLAQIAWATGRKQSEETKAKRAKKLNGNANALKRKYIATDASGTEHEVSNLNQFCKEHGLGHARMNGLANGDKLRTQHKGWKCRAAE